METDRVYSSEEDIKIARLILNYSSDLGFNDPTVVSCKERQNKYSVHLCYLGLLSIGVI